MSESAIVRFAKLQHECRKIGMTGDVDAGKIKYQFVTYQRLRILIDPLFEKYGFCFTHKGRVEGDKNILSTTIYDVESGEEFLTSELTLTPRSSNPQDTGSVITYMKRYELTALLGIAADKDDDCFLDEDTIKERVKECISIEELQTLYKSLRDEQRKDYKNLFTERKEQIQNEVLDSATID